MKFISHRGNLDGQDLINENSPKQIDRVIQLGYDVEIDIRYINDNFYLGHDSPKYLIDIDWLYQRKNKLWIHLKNIDSLYKMNTDFNYFWHDLDKFTITSRGYIWSYPDFINNSITVVKQKINKLPSNILGVCTDYIYFYENI